MRSFYTPFKKNSRMKKIHLVPARMVAKGTFAVPPQRLKSNSVAVRFASLLLLLCGCASRKPVATADPLEGNLHTHVAYLADDKLEGRRTGTAGEKAAADYIAAAFAKAGLQPRGTTGFYQPFSVVEGRMIGKTTSLSINTKALELGKDFFPMAYSGTADIDAVPAVALMERGEPWFFNVADLLAQNKNNPHFDVDDAVMTKAKEIAAKGASALFVYNFSKTDDALKFDGKRRGEMLSIPIVYVTQEAARKYFGDASAAVAINAHIEVEELKRNGTNVVGMVDNGAAATIVLGAHFDHLGYGEDKNSRHTGTDLQIHNGADDNASGTAALIELGRLLKESKLKGNNYLLIAFSGEELGLYGSKHFVQTPTIDLATVNYMVNMDMVGRLNDSAKTLTVGGYGTSPTWGELYRGNNLFPAATFRFDSSGTGPSDHTSFYNKNIPVLFYFTGLHTDYHKPSDDVGAINFDGQAAIVKHIYSVLQATDKMPKLAFAKTREAQTMSTARFSVTLGIMPDYTYSGAGIRADGVSDGRPAQKAGLKAGDVITAIGDYKVNSMESYMQTLGKFKKGDRATVAYTRNGQSNVVAVEF